MILSKKSSAKSDVIFDGIIFGEKQSFRYLSVQIDSKFSFTDHITKIANKLSRFCGKYYRLRKVLGKDQLLKAYNPFYSPGFWIMRQQTKRNKKKMKLKLNGL